MVGYMRIPTVKYNIKTITKLDVSSMFGKLIKIITHKTDFLKQLHKIIDKI